MRGEIEAITSTHLGFRAGLEHFKVPMDRVAAAVWVKKPVVPDKEKKPAKEAPAPPEETGLQWLDLTNGGRLALRVESWNGKEVAGTHPTLGALHIPLDLLAGFRMEAPPVSIGQAALADWTLETTPDPVLPEAGGGDSALAGKAAEDFKLPLLEGGDFLLKDQSGKVVVLNFWATWCPPCVEEMPLIDAFFRQNKQNGWQVVGLAIDQPSRVKQFLSQFPVTYTIGLAGLNGTELGKMLGNEQSSLPFTVVLDAQGLVQQRKLGKLTPEDIKNWTI